MCKKMDNKLVEFDREITESKGFLEMEVEAQVLYFHLGLRTDNNGIIEPYHVMHKLGVSDNALESLLIKGFIQRIDEHEVKVLHTEVKNNGK